jgi:hypothetical protein
MKRLPGMLVVVCAVLLIAPSASLADPGTTLSFFSGGNGAHADWFVTADQPAGDNDNQAIRLLTVNGAPTYAHGYAGILFHHVEGISAAAFLDSSFWNRTPDQYVGEPATFGSPRLVVTFQNAAGQFDGYGDLRQNIRGNGWEKVSDITDSPNSAWDVMGGPPPCGFLYNVTWPVVQGCFVGDTVQSAYIVADAYGIYHLIDDITVNGKTFSSASDNGNGNNTPAGPSATTDPTLVPAVLVLVPASH